MVRNVGAGASPEEWFRSLPPITRWYFATVLLLTAAASFGVINPAQLTLDLPRLWQKFETVELVRPPTPKAQSNQDMGEG